MSLTDIQFLPVLPLAIFIAISVIGVTTATITKYISTGEVNGFPIITISWAVIIPEES